MAVNSATLALIKEHEGLRLDAYPDPAHGWKVPSIGYGHTDAAGPPKVTKGMRITAAEAEDILVQDLKLYEAAVQNHVTVPLTENQYGALVSFAFNLGPTNLKRSTLLKKLNAGDYAGAAAEFGKWIHAGGKVFPGLVRRREAERQLFLTPDPFRQPDDPGVDPGGEPKPDYSAVIVIALAALAIAGALFFGR